MRPHSTLLLFSLFTSICGGSYCAETVKSPQLAVLTHPISAQEQASLTPTQIIKRLKLGNKRYRTGHSLPFSQQVVAKETGLTGQHPVAFVLTGIDSRSVPDILFNQPMGSLLVGRVGGNVLDSSEIASIEFAVLKKKVRLLVVLGQVQSDWVKAACQMDDVSEALNGRFSRIEPAVRRARKVSKVSIKCDKRKDLGLISLENTIIQSNRLSAESPVLGNMVSEGQIKIVGAMHDTKTGEVIFFDQSGRSV